MARDHPAMGIVNKDGAAVYKRQNFKQMEAYVEDAKGVTAETTVSR